MGLGQWMRVLDTMGGLAELAGRVVGGRADVPPPQTGSGPAGPAGAIGPLGQIEARLTGVLIAALKEAFDPGSSSPRSPRLQWRYWWHSRQIRPPMRFASDCLSSHGFVDRRDRSRPQAGGEASPKAR